MSAAFFPYQYEAYKRLGYGRGEMMTEQCGAIYEGEICRRYKGHLTGCDYLPMSVIEKIGRLSHTERVYIVDGPGDHGEAEYAPFVDASELKRLAESHRRLLAMVTGLINLGTPHDHEPGCGCVVCENWKLVVAVYEKAKEL